MNKRAMAKALLTEAVIAIVVLATVWGVNNGLKESLIKLAFVAGSISVFLLTTYAIYMVYESDEDHGSKYGPTMGNN